MAPRDLLPPELWLQIIAHIDTSPEDDLTKNEPHTPYGLRSVINLSTTCSFFRTLCLATIFRHVVIRRHNGKAVLQLLQYNESIGCLVRSLKIDWERVEESDNDDMYDDDGEEELYSDEDDEDVDDVIDYETGEGQTWDTEDNEDDLNGYTDYVEGEEMEEADEDEQREPSKGVEVMEEMWEEENEQDMAIEEVQNNENGINDSSPNRGTTESIHIDQQSGTQGAARLQSRSMSNRWEDTEDIRVASPISPLLNASPSEPLPETASTSLAPEVSDSWFTTTDQQVSTDMPEKDLCKYLKFIFPLLSNLQTIDIGAIGHELYGLLRPLNLYDSVSDPWAQTDPNMETLYTRELMHRILGNVRSLTANLHPLGIVPDMMISVLLYIPQLRELTLTNVYCDDDDLESDLENNNFALKLTHINLDACVFNNGQVLSIIKRCPPHTLTTFRYTYPSTGNVVGIDNQALKNALLYHSQSLRHLDVRDDSSWHLGVPFTYMGDLSAFVVLETLIIGVELLMGMELSVRLAGVLPGSLRKLEIKRGVIRLLPNEKEEILGNYRRELEEERKEGGRLEKLAEVEINLE